MPKVYESTLKRVPTTDQLGLLLLVERDHPDNRREIGFTKEDHDCLAEARYRFQPGPPAEQPTQDSFVVFAGEDPQTILAQKIATGRGYRRAIDWLVGNLAADGMHAVFDGIAENISAVMDRRFNAAGADEAWFKALCGRIVDTGGTGTAATIDPESPFADAGRGPFCTIKVTRDGVARWYALGPGREVGFDYLGRQP